MAKSTVPAPSSLASTLASEFEVYAATGENTDFLEDIASRILSMSDADAIIGAMSSTVDIPLDVPILVERVSFMRSRFDESKLGYFAVVNGKYLESGSWGLSGEPFVGTCGGDTICLSFLRLNQLGSLPKAMRIVQRSTPTAAGYYPLNLAPADVRTV
jgi:hypothetical protein